MATHTPPAAWWAETDETLATVVQLLDQQAVAAGKARRGR